MNIMRNYTILLFVLLSFFWISDVSAQAVIVTMEGEEIEVYTVRNIGQENVTYQINQGGPLSYILRTEVYEIIYSDGRAPYYPNRVRTSYRKFAIGINPLTIVLNPSYAFGELEYLSSRRISFGLRTRVYTDKELKAEGADATFQRNDFSFSLFGRYYFSNEESLSGPYAGVELGTGIVDLSLNKTENRESTIERDWSGSGNNFFLGLQVGYKLALLEDRLFVEPTVSGGFQQNNVPLTYSVRVQNPDGQNSTTIEFSYDQIQLYVFPGLSLGLLF